MLDMIKEITGTVLYVSILAGIAIFWGAVIKSRLKAYKESHPKKYDKYMNITKKTIAIASIIGIALTIAQCIYLMFV